MADVDLLIPARVREIVPGVTVRRVLPFRRRRSVGPFVFLDHMGPMSFTGDRGMDIGPHPHIGLATVTYLFDGQLLHHDGLGSEQIIVPGDVNWMSAGRGIVHSERSVRAAAPDTTRLHGIQSWVALPQTAEESAPTFAHHARDTLPLVRIGDATLRLIAGTGWNVESPVRTASPLFYAELTAPSGTPITLPPEHPERAIYVVAGSVRTSAGLVEAGTLAVLHANDGHIVTETDTHAMLLGGAPLDGPRHIWWNFVSSSEARIEAAKRDWREGRFTLIPGETDLVPLPE